MNITEVLRDHGYKVTPQRLAVYEVIDQNKTHPNAEAIYKELQPKYPSMSLATVYKTMEIFAKIGVVQVLQCDEESHRYDFNVSPHAHIRCSVCNRVDDIDFDMEEIKKSAAQASHYKIDGIGLSFVGVCEECQKNQNR